MVNFIYIDLALLVIFCIWIFLFLKKNKKKVKKEGIFYLYKTKIGLKFIDNVAKKYPKTLKVLAYVSITFGFLAMIFMIFLLIQNVILLAKIPEAIKAPPIMPVLPYVPQLFKVPGLPDFYFTHWIIILIILATTHEFSHGIFARLYNVRIKSTGFGFLGPIIMAFVEQDEKQMNRKKKKEQMAILSAGPFSNFIFMIIFGLIFILFLFLSIAPTTPIYAATAINSSQISSIYLDNQNLNIGDIQNLNIKDIQKTLPEKIPVSVEINNPSTNLTENQIFLLTKEYLIQQFSAIKSHKNETIIIHYDAPLINSNVEGEILSINGISIKDTRIIDELQKTQPYQEIKIETTKDTYKIIADKNPLNESKGFIGISYNPKSTSTAGKIISFFSPAKNQFMNYAPRYNQEVFSFFSTLFIWLILLCFAVATFNMLPFGFLDGGKFFYLAVLSMTKKKKLSEKIYKGASMIIVLIFVAMVVVWLLRLIWPNIFL
jgi:membrane-associated protease RseP (regulator of RpoE activity)